MTKLWEQVEERFPQELSPDALPLPAAWAMAAMLSSGSYDGARLVCCRGGERARPDAVVLRVEVDVPLGQRKPVNNIQSTEPFVIFYSDSTALPAAYPIRDDFPFDVPHLHLALGGQLRSLCLFEMPLEEALRIATPLVFIERVRFWLAETAHGRLHGEDQPLDPIFAPSPTPVILPSKGIDSEKTDLLFGWRASDEDGHPVFLEDASGQQTPKPEDPRRAPALSVISVVTKPLPHARLRMFPMNVAELIEVFRELNADILPEIQAALQAWIKKPLVQELMDKPCLIVVRTPIERVPGQVGAHAAKAFLTECKAKELGEKIGAFFSDKGYVGPVIGPPHPAQMEALRTLNLVAMDVHRPFDREMAQTASGISLPAGEPVTVTLVGAGALGSQIAITAARMGLGSWRITDPDHLLPHNEARHASSSVFVGWPKAKAVVHEIQMLLGDEAAAGAFGKIDRAPPDDASLKSKLIVDASASVPTARWLGAVSRHEGRTASVFLNPAGSDMVCLLEGAGRTPRLDHVEMSYYATLLGDEAPANHLSDGRVGLYPSGGCRTPSLAISQADIGTLAPFAVRRLLRDPWPDTGLIEFRRVTDDGVTTARFTPNSYRVVVVADWAVSVSEEVLAGIIGDRHEAGHQETGGILVGAWDRQTRQGYVVRCFTPPPDSVSMPSGFIRGAEGVYQELAEVQRRTANNLTYVGEWHTHPAGMRSAPSQDDRILLRWIAANLIYLDVPPMMLIAGEDGLRILLGRPDGRILGQALMV